MRVLALICGIGLGILWLVSLGNTNAAPWLTWLDGVGALLSFVVAGVGTTRMTAIVGPGVVSAGLFVLWIIGMSTNGAPYQNWLTFVAACLMAIATFIGGATTRARLPHYPASGTPTGTTTEEERNRFRKSA